MKWMQGNNYADECDKSVKVRGAVQDDYEGRICETDSWLGCDVVQVVIVVTQCHSCIAIVTLGCVRDQFSYI